MTHFGVNRLVLLNSGNYLQANIALDHPVHLAASNNRGKSTLVNSLQFLFISDRNKMRFGKRTLEDSLKHYFGEQRSYIVFECQTPTGDQCMLVRGRGSLGGNKFERYVFDGKYVEEDFLSENREMLDFESVQTRLADRHLTPVKGSELWSVLAANAPISNRSSTARLGLLPIKQRDDYTAFCEVFVRLLSLQTTDARTLRQLVIESHARDIGERRIDIAGEYSEQFATAERSEHELAFMRSVIDEVDQGIELRRNRRETIEQLSESKSSVWQEAAAVRQSLSEHSQTLVKSNETLSQQFDQTSTEEAEALTCKGAQSVELARIQKAWDDLLQLHDRWSNYSPEFIAQMRLDSEKIAQDIADRRRQISQSAKLDLGAMQRSVKKLKNSIEADKRYLKNSERTLIAWLSQNNLTRDEIAKLFCITHPELLKSIVGESGAILDSIGLVKRAKEIAARVADGWYADEAIKIQLPNVNADDLESLLDIESVRNTLKLDEQKLDDEEARLEIAIDQEAAKQRLAELERTGKAKTDQLREYDSYVQQWAARESLEHSLKTARNALAETESKLSRLKIEKAQLVTAQTESAKEISQTDEKLKGVNNAAVKFREVLTENAIVDDLNSGDLENEQGELQKINRDYIFRVADNVISQLGKLTRKAGELSGIKEQLSKIELTIQAEARKAQSAPRYFNDSEEEWRQLTEARLAFDDLETAATKEWNHLFTTLGARMNAIVTAVRRIKQEVRNINSGVKKNRVSNLVAVEISVEEIHDTYTAVEALAEPDSMFNDRDLIESAKRHLRTMITASQVIELESLFEIKINIQDLTGKWRRAASLDEIGSTGTGMTVKAMIFIQLIRAIASDERYRIHFYIDGLGELDDANLSATASLAVSRGILPITADPRLHLEPLAHPSVTVYSLGQDSNGKFYVDATRSYQAKRIASEPTDNDTVEAPTDA